MMSMVVFLLLTRLLAAGQFVQRSGNQLTLNGKPFRFAGGNIYWLGLDENEPPGAIAYPTPFRLTDTTATARLMGATVVRCHTCGISTGNKLSFESALKVFNTTAIKHIDAAIAEAKRQGLHLIVPLTDNYRYYNGGKHDFTDWRGIANETEFYSDANVLADFQEYIRNLITHVNTCTGLALRDDPTILAWETGNELISPADWTISIAKYIKSLDHNHLVLDGHYGINPAVLSSDAIDIVSDHYYPYGDVSKLHADAALAASAQKVFVVGEFGWTQGNLSQFVAAVEADARVSGDLYWSLFGHADNYGYVQHGDTFTLHYPGDNADMKQRASILRDHAFKMSGLEPPTPPAPPAPLITMAVAATGQIAWRGSAGAAEYIVQRSSDQQQWSVVCAGCVNDNQLPWKDNSAGGASFWYRVAAASTEGAVGPYSAPMKSL